MKLKSLLLGSAAALALSTGAQAADPIANFVSLGVCDAYGITGLTIENGDTCLRISGEIEYTYEFGERTGFGGDADGFYTDSEVDWQLVFEATTQTDAGAAIARLRLADGAKLFNGNTNVVIDQAYVQFGDSTVLSAGRKGSIFDTEILDREYGWLNFDEVQKSYLDNTVATGGHVIQIESLIADGFTVLVALEDLQLDFDSSDPDTWGGGTFGVGLEYSTGGISGEIGVLLGGLYGPVVDADGTVGPTDPVNFYARAAADFDAFGVRAGVLVDDTGDWIASLGASATFDMFSLSADAIYTENEDFNVGVEGSFDATDTIAVYLGAAYTAGEGIMSATYLDNARLTGATETFAVYGGVNVAVTETISANGELGYVDLGGADLVYGAAGVTYAPGGNFETSLDLYADTEDQYSVSFAASKSF